MLCPSCPTANDPIADIDAAAMAGKAKAMAPHLFTLLCEYDGGSHLHQVYASDAHAALLKWASVVKAEKPLGHAASERVARLAAATPVADEVEITPVKGLTGVWCWSTLDADELVLTTIVRSS